MPSPYALNTGILTSNPSEFPIQSTLEVILVAIAQDSPKSLNINRDYPPKTVFFWSNEVAVNNISFIEILQYLGQCLCAQTYLMHVKKLYQYGNKPVMKNTLKQTGKIIIIAYLDWIETMIHSFYSDILNSFCTSIPIYYKAFNNSVANVTGT